MPYTPFVPRSPGPAVFAAIVGQIQVLPQDVIGPVVLHYTQQEKIAKLVEDMRDAQFAALEPARKEAVYADYISCLVSGLKLAENAVSALNSSLGQPELAERVQ